MSTIAIIAALERELTPLVRRWESTSFSYQGRNFRAFEHENLVAVAGGIGSQAATLVAKAIVAQYKPRALISAGLAGALVPALSVGSVITPNVIIGASTGAGYRCDAGEGVLVTAGEIADSTSKQALADKFNALAVDMEAAAVAEVTLQAGISFQCVKAISDAADFVMPPVNRFVDGQGNFQTGKFVSWMALHPLYWRRTMALARNSKRATNALCDWLAQHVVSGFQAGMISKLNRFVMNEAEASRRSPRSREETLSSPLREGRSGYPGS